MTKLIKILLTIIILTSITSCSSKKQILYLNQDNDNQTYDYNYVQYKIKPDDILKIDINSDIPEIASSFNPNGSAANFSDKNSMLYNGYQVDYKGSINIPLIGQISVEGLNVSEIRDMLFKKIKSEGILINPSVDVKVINLNFTILGEVNKPGRYDYLKNNLNILEAIGIAGDLTITGKRNDIKVIRDVKGKKSIYSIDVSKKEFLSSDIFQIKSGDIIIVNPNTTRIKTAGIIGNSGTLLSLLSFLLTSIIIIRN